jgi:hypothetical protein
MYVVREDHHIHIAAIASISMIAVIALFYTFYGWLGADTMSWLIDLSSVLFSATCAVLCGILWHHFRKGEVLKKIWGNLWIGLILWTAAEIVYAVYELFILKDTPYPSLADVFFVPGFIPIFLALYYRYSSLRIAPSPGAMLATGAAFLVVISLSLVFVLGPIIRSPGSGTPVEQILNIVYPVGDLLIVLGALLSMLALAGGELSLPWGLIALACLILGVSDSLYSYATWTGVYMPDNTINPITAVTDISYVAGYITMAFGLYVQARLQRIL